MKYTEKAKNCLKKLFLIYEFHLALRRSTMTYSMRSRCSSFAPKTIKFRAEIVFNSPVSELIVSRYLGIHDVQMNHYVIVGVFVLGIVCLFVIVCVTVFNSLSL